MIPLVPHPSTPESTFGVAAGVERVGERVRFVYRVVGALDVVALPSPVSARRIDRLWEHTCFEAFVAIGDGPGYLELNVAPSSAWALYGFARYRERTAAEPPAIPEVGVARGAGSLDVEATLPFPSGPLRVGLTAVIERTDGQKSYWALRHPSAVPDFHHADGFVLHLA